MSNELQRRLAAVEKRLFAAPSPCRDHFPPIIHAEEGETAARAGALLEAMQECLRCGPAKIGGGPRVLVIGTPTQGSVDVLPVTVQETPTDDGEFIC